MFAKLRRSIFGPNATEQQQTLRSELKTLQTSLSELERKAALVYKKAQRYFVQYPIPNLSELSETERLSIDPTSRFFWKNKTKALIIEFHPNLCDTENCRRQIILSGMMNHELINKNFRNLNSTHFFWR